MQKESAKKLNTIGSVFSALYFIVLMLPSILALIYVTIHSIVNIKDVMVAGTSLENNSTTYVIVFGFILGLSLLIPPLRKIYYKLPWMFSFTKITFINFCIISIGYSIIDYGYEVQNTSRHAIFITLMILQIVVCRALMCFYLYKKPIKSLGE